MISSIVIHKVQITIARRHLFLTFLRILYTLHIRKSSPINPMKTNKVPVVRRQGAFPGITRKYPQKSIPPNKARRIPAVINALQMVFAMMNPPKESKAS